MLERPPAGPSVLTETHPPGSPSRTRAEPRALIACHTFGVPSEVWIQRQIATFSRCERHVLAWDAVPGAMAVSGVPLENLGLDFDAPEKGWQRWWRRLLLLPSGNFCGAIGAERQQLDAVVRRVRPDVILCHFGLVALRLLPTALAQGVPLVAHFHGNDISSSLRNHRYYRWSLKRCVHQFAGTVVVGSHQRRVLQSFGVPDQKIALIPCGAPVELFTPKRAYATDRCRFIAVSRLVAWKGVDYTLRAFAAARQQRPEVELHIVGGGQDERRLRALATELKLHDAVLFHGEKNSEEVRTLLTACDVFVQHSLDHSSGWTEGFGVSIAEASACGLPVVVTDSGGIVDQVTHGENGLITPQRSVEALTTAMLQLCDDLALRQRLGQAGRERVAQHFDSTTQARKLEDCLLAVTRSTATTGQRGSR